jgi:hypothetical protein
MNIRRATATVALVGTMATNSIAPAPAYADLQEALIITGAVTGCYVGTVLIGTAIYRRKWGPFELTSGHTSVRRKRQRDGLRLGPRCPQTSPNLTLLCW